MWARIKDKKEAVNELAYGLGTITYSDDDKDVVISYSGNMGSSIDGVNEMLNHYGYPIWDAIKMMTNWKWVQLNGVECRDLSYIWAVRIPKQEFDLVFNRFNARIR